MNQLIFDANIVLKYGSKSQLALANKDLRDEHDKLMACRPLESKLLQSDAVNKLRNYAEQLLNHFIEDDFPEQIKQIFTSRKSDDPLIEYTSGGSTDAQQEFDTGPVKITNEMPHFASVDGNQSVACLNEQQTFASVIGKHQTIFSNGQDDNALKLSDLAGVTKREPQNKTASLPRCHSEASSSKHS